LLQYKGLEATTVSHASLIVGTLPILVALFSSLLLEEKLKAFEYGLMVASAGGAALIAIGKRVAVGPQPTTRGDLLVFLSMFAAMGMVLLSKHLMAHCGALQTRHADSARMDRSNAPYARSFFGPHLARGSGSRNSLHHSRVPLVELGFGPNTRSPCRNIS
jgi:EamA-like transporter family